MKQGEKWLHLEYVVHFSYIQPGGFVFAVLLPVQRLITKTDKCPDLLVASRDTLVGTDRAREQRFNLLLCDEPPPVDICVLKYVHFEYFRRRTSLFQTSSDL